MVRVARPVDRRKEVVEQAEGACILPVIRNVLLVHLRERDLLSVLDRARQQIEAVHSPVINCYRRSISVVSDVDKGMVGRVLQRNYLTRA